MTPLERELFFHKTRERYIGELLRIRTPKEVRESLKPLVELYSYHVTISKALELRKHKVYHVDYFAVGYDVSLNTFRRLNLIGIVEEQIDSIIFKSVTKAMVYLKELRTINYNEKKRHLLKNAPLPKSHFKKELRVTIEEEDRFSILNLEEQKINTSKMMKRKISPRVEERRIEILRIINERGLIWTPYELSFIMNEKYHIIAQDLKFIRDVWRFPVRYDRRLSYRDSDYHQNLLKKIEETKIS